MTSLAAAAGGGGASTETATTKKTVDLSDKLEKTACYARNEHNRFPWTNLIIGDNRLGCKSDADEQLILHFEFSEFVRVHSIKLTEFNNGVEPEENPTREYLYCNNNAINSMQCINGRNAMHEYELNRRDDRWKANDNLAIKGYDTICGVGHNCDTTVGRNGVVCLACSKIPCRFGSYSQSQSYLQ